MLIFPAIDLYKGRAVRLYKGDYAQMTVYSEHPEETAAGFAASGATHIHIVDLEGAKSGGTPNFEIVRRIKSASGVFCQVGGGIRSMAVIERYLSAGIDRVILGTAAATDEAFVREAVSRSGDAVAVGADIRGGFVAVRGWTETTSLDLFTLCGRMRSLGVATLICTDISRDGAMRGANRLLYQELSKRFDMKIVASGGVSTLDDVRSLAEMGLYGAVIGKACYTGAIDLKKAIEVAE